MSLADIYVSQLNPDVTAFQRPFTPRLRRLAEASRRLRLFEGQIRALAPPLGIPPLSAIPPFTTVGPRAQNAYDELDDKLKEHERRLADMNRSWEELGKRKSELEEKRCVLRETAGFFNEVGPFRHHLRQIWFSLLIREARLSTDTPRSGPRSMMEMARNRSLNMPQNSARFPETLDLVDLTSSLCQEPSTE